MGLAVQMYHDGGNTLPPSRVSWSGGVTWTVLLLPYLEQDNFYRQWNIFQPFNAQPSSLAQTPVRLYYCPSRRGPMTSRYNAPVPASWPPGPPPPWWPPGMYWPPPSWPAGPPPGTSGWPSWPPAGTTGGANGEIFRGSVGDYASVAGNDPVPGDGYDNGCPTTGPGPGCRSPTGTCYNSECANGALILAQFVPSPGGPGVMSWSSRTSFTSIIDGLSNTLLIGEKHVPLDQFGQNWIPPPGWPLASPFENPGDGAIYNGDFPWVATRIAGRLNPLAREARDVPRNNFGSYHPGVCQFVFCDGSVRALNVSIDPNVLGLMASRNDGQAVPDF
jgi:prepilin-type processing-associated H-X9-DG protein